MHGRSDDTNLTKIHYEMSELFDNQVNAQKEKNLWGSCKLLQAHKKREMKMKQTKKENNDTHIKMLLMEGDIL